MENAQVAVAALVLALKMKNIEVCTDLIGTKKEILHCNLVMTTLFQSESKILSNIISGLGGYFEVLQWCGLCQGIILFTS